MYAHDVEGKQRRKKCDDSTETTDKKNKTNNNNIKTTGVAETWRRNSTDQKTDRN